MRLYKYLSDNLLLEKVNKKEITQILNSTDVLIGAEFEFIIDELDGGYKKALEDYNNFMKEFGDLETWKNEIMNFEDYIYDNSGNDSDYKKLSNMKKKYEKMKRSIKPGKHYLKYEMLEPKPQHKYWNYEISKPYPLDDEEENTMVELLMQQALDDIKPPFKNYDIGKYDNIKQSVGSKIWAVENDVSLGHSGIEVKSPPLTIKEFIKICPKVFDWVDKIGYTNPKCGFHVHISLKNIPNLKQKLDLIKLILFTDEQYIYKYFKEREGNKYAISMKKNKDWFELLTNDLEKKSQHYNAINWEGLSYDHGHIEFRYMGSTNYHKKWNKIQVIIAQYAYNLSLACNPNFKRKEYKLKLDRLNKSH
jgi:hypothetical protein